MNPTSFLTRLALIAAVAALAACSKPAPPEEPVRAVKVVVVAADGIRSGYEYAAEVRPRTESRLGFRVGGKLLRRMADVGQHVSAGQALAQLDPQDFKLSVDAARAQLAAAVANRDLAVVQSLLLLVAATMIASNFIVDLLYGWIDPRLTRGNATKAGA